MRYLFVVMMSFFVVFSVGCSSKAEPQKSEVVEVNDEYSSDEDEFLSEFDDELVIEEKFDPFSGYNRVMTGFNDGVYHYALSPVAKGYRYVVHKEIRTSVNNFFHNILYPLRLANNLLQGKFKNSGEETGRFLINSTVGILGLFDPAKSYFGLEAHDEDFGQTLGVWGVGAGPHIVLPFLGPSNLRDSLSLYPDYLLDPVGYDSDRSYNLARNTREGIYLNVYKTVNKTSLNVGEYEMLTKDAIDLYPYLRDVYEQYREQKIKE